MDDSPSLPPVAVFEDRSTSLIVFGILVILLGGLCALLVPLAVVGQVMSAKMTGGAPNYRMAIPGMLMYGVLAVALVWLGIGSIRYRRWARALLLIFSWSWLTVGVIAVGFLLLFAPKMMEGVPPGAARIVAMIVAGVMWSVMFVIIPGVLVGFYQGRNVKATCEARDATVRWTDACPLPVLAVAVWFAFGTLMMVTMPLVYNSVLPFFGVLLSGLPGRIAFLFSTALWAFLAWGWYRLKPIAWWITLGVLLLFAISNIVTFTRVELMDMYRLMNYPPEQLAMIERYNFLTGQTMVWWSACFMIPLLGYLVWVKRFFRRDV